MYTKIRWSLVDFKLIEPIAKTLMNGLLKYKVGGWKKVSKEDHFDALMRHLVEYRMGVTKDHESELHPLYHAITRLYFLIGLEELK